MDEHVQSAITKGLRFRGIDVLTVQEDAREGFEDCLILDRAGELGRIIFTCDGDFLIEAHRRQSEGIYFTGVLYIRQSNVYVGRCIDDLEIIAKVCSVDELANTVKYLPL